MKGKYITTQVLLACKAKPVGKANQVQSQKAMPDELKQIAEPKFRVRSFELVAA
jgi:hypothetical protein